MLPWPGTPLGKPAHNACKWFATVEIERMSGEPVWLDKRHSNREKQVQKQNQKQRGKEEADVPQRRSGPYRSVLIQGGPEQIQKTFDIFAGFS